MLNNSYKTLTFNLKTQLSKTIQDH